MSKVFTLAEYLQYETEFEGFYEVENGQIVKLPTDSFLNNHISMKLIMMLSEYIDLKRILNKVEIIVSGRRFNSRFPDLVVLSKEQLPEFYQLRRSTISIDMLPPLLVIEVVSSGKKLESEITDIKDLNMQLEGLNTIGLSIHSNKHLAN